jgi:hypothetical protein
VKPLALLFATLILGACDRSGGGHSPSPGASASESPAASAPASVASTASTAVAPGQRSTWTGSYKSAVGSLYIPADWKGVRWSSPDTEKGLGDGALALEVDAVTGRVQGTLDGALGPATVDGVASDGKLSATIMRKNPSDRGFAGTLVGTIDKEHATGTMNLSSGEASAIRTATFTLAPAGR